MKYANPIYAISVKYDGKTIIHPMAFQDYDDAVRWIETRNNHPTKVLNHCHEWYSPQGVFTIHILNLW